MAKYRKKPIIIEAEQWWPPSYGVNKHTPIEGVICEYVPGIPGGYKVYIETLEGNMEVSIGDWVITGVKGEKYPCKPDIFEATYELVEEMD